MNARHSLAIALLACLPLTACGDSSKPPASSPSSASTQQPTSTLGRVVDKQVREARERIRKENIGLNDTIQVNAGKGGSRVFIKGDGVDQRPKAEITPAGDLLIDGKPVAIDAGQRALLMEYREHVIGVAENGMNIGVEGADLAAKAMGEAFKGLLSGKSEQEIEASVEAEAARIKASVVKLCGRLPAMMAAQQKLATAVPEFEPYATMTQDDIDDCLEDTEEHTASVSMNPAEEAAAAALEDEAAPESN